MKTYLSISILCVFFSTSINIFAGDRPYEFEWDSKNDMRAAWFMCATTGFSQGECPKVHRKCWQPPLIYFVKHRSHYHVKTECKKPSVFSSPTSPKELEELNKYATDVYPNEQAQQLESNIQDVYDPAKLYTKEAIIE